MKNCDVCVVSTSADEDEVLVRVQVEQQKDGELCQIIGYLERKGLPAEGKKTVIAANQGYFLMDGILYNEATGSPVRRNWLCHDTLGREY